MLKLGDAMNPYENYELLMELSYEKATIWAQIKQRKEVVLLPVTEDFTYYKERLAEEFHMSIDESSERIQMLLKEPGIKGFEVINQEGKKIGICGAYEQNTCYSLFDLCIEQAEQNKGYGKAMLQKLISDTIKKPKRYLLQVSGKNQAAVRLYEAAGFSITQKLPVS